MAKIKSWARWAAEAGRTRVVNKYHAEKVGGYDSKKEYRRANELRMMERAGLISELREQVRYELLPVQRDEAGRLMERAAAYVADFVYKNKEGQVVVEDAKGVRTDVYRLKKKLMLYVHGVRIKEV